MMKWIGSCSIVAMAALLLLGSAAKADLTALANWNEVSDPLDWYVDSGLDYRISDTNLPCQVASDLHGTGQMPEVELGTGRWGGGLVDGPGDNGLYEYMNVSESASVALVDAQGTVEFWFKPDWDPTGEQFNRRGIFSIQGGGGWKGSHFFILSKPTDGDWVDPNGYWAVDHYRHTEEAYAGFNFTGNQNMIQDWNHIAYTWDGTGNRLYMNGAKVGEKLYVPGDLKLEWAIDTYIFLGSFQGFEGYDADGTYDALAVWDEVRYTGETYTVPTEEPAFTGALDGDLDGDGFVGQSDLDIVLGAWGQNVPPADPRADPSGDNFVGQTDLDTVLGDWGQGTPPAVPEPATLAVLGLGGLLLRRRR